MKQVNFVKNEQPHQLGKSSFSSSSGDNVPFFGGANDQVRFGNLLFGHLRVSGTFANFEAITRQPLAKVTHHLLYQGLHGSNVNDLELVSSDVASGLINVLANFPHNG